MKQIFRKLSLAALVIVGAMTVGCTGALEEVIPNSPEETTPSTPEETQQQPESKTVTLTTTISLGDAGTKALDAAGVKTFAVGDQVAVIYKDGSKKTQKALSTPLVAGDIHDGGKKANIKVTLTDPAQNGALRYIYPAAMAKATIATDAKIDDAGTIDFTRLDAQDGTLATLASSYDLAVYDGNLTGDAALPASATLTNKLTIGEFTIKNADGSINITNTITSLTVTDGTNTYTITRAAAEGPIYVAMKPVTNDKTLTFTINANATPKVVTGKTLAAGKMYPVGLKFGSSVALSSVTTTDENTVLYYAAQNGDILSGSSSSAAYVTVADGATVTLNDVEIDAPDLCDHAALHCLGNVNIVLAGSDRNELRSGVASGYPAVFVPKGDTLTISGTAVLLAYANDSEGGAGIGGGFINSSYTPIDCGTIVIAGGAIFAFGSAAAAGIGSGLHSSCDSIQITGGAIYISQGGDNAAGIGSGQDGTCGDIVISGGQIGGVYESTHYYGAKGGRYGAGIGCGGPGTCGDITIGAGITYLSASKGGDAYDNIGLGTPGECGTVSIHDSLTIQEWSDYIIISPPAP